MLGLLALASAAVVLLAGSFLRQSPNPLGSGRILAYVPIGETGTAYLLGTDGSVREALELPAGACPQLLRDADAVAVRRRSDWLFQALADGAMRQVSLNYTGGERWSANGRAFALVDIEAGPISVFTFPDGDAANPTVARYPVAGALDGVFSPDGDRLVVLVPVDASTLGVHVLAAGVDALVAAVPSEAVTSRPGPRVADAMLALITRDPDGPG